MVLLLPVYQPSSHLSALVAEIDCPVVVVDDGSTPAVEGLPCTVLRHPRNSGKGVALRTGFRHIMAAYPGEDVVCADADGQHSVADIRRISEAVRDTGHTVLGVRRVRRMPLRSRVGNALTRLLFRATTGRSVRDTQTGLRGYPGDLLPWLLTIPGDRFEYEMNVLLAAAREGHPYSQVEIATTYLDDNASSHFGAVGDAVRIYRSLLKF
ncbi:glycosyltransferase family 2 protein [Actinoplanes sp. NPDC049596]|uniref:glycosyltransferase family 2 protein n=1 Tax=unclassified Actinoplanes TaxID=2626549 RepID=UPI00344325F6